MVILSCYNINRQLYLSICFIELQSIHHCMWPSTSGFPVRLSDWLLQSCQADCLASVFGCYVVRLTASKLSGWLPYSWVIQWCQVHTTLTPALESCTCVTAHGTGYANRPVGRYNSFVAVISNVAYDLTILPCYHSDSSSTEVVFKSTHFF